MPDVGKDRRTQYYCMRKQMGEREGAAAQGRFLAALCDVFPPPAFTFNQLQPQQCCSTPLTIHAALQMDSVFPASAAIAYCKLHASIIALKSLLVVIHWANPPLSPIALDNNNIILSKLGQFLNRTV